MAAPIWSMQESSYRSGASPYKPDVRSMFGLSVDSCFRQQFPFGVLCSRGDTASALASETPSLCSRTIHIREQPSWPGSLYRRRTQA
jgi:hypothetical protein